jgi:hypothetical protein
MISNFQRLIEKHDASLKYTPEHPYLARANEMGDVYFKTEKSAVDFCDDYLEYEFGEESDMEEFSDMSVSKIIAMFAEGKRTWKPDESKLDEDGLDEEGYNWDGVDYLTSYHVVPISQLNQQKDTNDR